MNGTYPEMDPKARKEMVDAVYLMHPGDALGLAYSAARAAIVNSDGDKLSADDKRLLRAAARLVLVFERVAEAVE